MDKFILVFFVFLISCGQDASIESRSENPAVSEPVGGGSGPNDSLKISYQKMAGYLNTYCNSCHASDKFMKTEKDLRASSVKTRIANGSMPLPGAKPLPSAVKVEMVNFF